MAKFRMANAKDMTWTRFFIVIGFSMVSIGFSAMSVVQLGTEVYNEYVVQVAELFLSYFPPRLSLALMGALFALIAVRSGDAAIANDMRQGGNKPVRLIIHLRNLFFALLATMFSMFTLTILILQFGNPFYATLSNEGSFIDMINLPIFILDVTLGGTVGIAIDALGVEFSILEVRPDAWLYRGFVLGYQILFVSLIARSSWRLLILFWNNSRATD